MTYKVLVLKGDGIGPEVVSEAVQVLKVVARRAAVDFAFDEAVVGGAAIDAYGVPMRPETLKLASECDAVLFGAVGGPKWDNPNAAYRPEQALLTLRKELDLYANLRPVKTVKELLSASPLRPEIVSGVDLIVVRELTSGLYYGQPSEKRQGREGREAVDTCFYSEAEIARAVRFGFDLARRRRKRLTLVDKANILSTSRLWREVATEIARENSDVAFETVLVDAMAMHLLRRPKDFDVVVTENMFGDILTDEASMLAGSMGLLPSASVGAEMNSVGSPIGLYEPIHGTAPDIVGRDRANPVAAILSAAMMLDLSFGMRAEAEWINDAVAAVLREGYRTPDIAGAGTKMTGCKAMGRLVRERLEIMERDA